MFMLMYTLYDSCLMFMLQTTPVTTAMTWTQTTWPVCSTPGRKPPQMSASGLPVNSIPARSSTPLWTFLWSSLSPRPRLQHRLPWTSKPTSLLVRWDAQTHRVHEARTFDFNFHPEEFKTLRCYPKLQRLLWQARSNISSGVIARNSGEDGPAQRARRALPEPPACCDTTTSSSQESQRKEGNSVEKEMEKRLLSFV